MNITEESENYNVFNNKMVEYRIDTVEDIKSKMYYFNKCTNLKATGIVINDVTYRNLWLNGHIKKSEFLEDKINAKIYIDNTIKENTIKLVV